MLQVAAFVFAPLALTLVPIPAEPPPQQQGVDCNPIARLIADGLGVPLTDPSTSFNGLPSIYYYGYPYLASGPGGNADYGVDNTCLVPADRAHAYEVAIRMLKNGFIRPMFYLGSPLRLAAAYTTAMRPKGYVPTAPEDDSNGTAIIEGFPVCAYDLEHLPTQLFHVLAKRDDVQITLNLPGGAQFFTNAGELGRLLLNVSAQSTMGMLRNYFTPYPGVAPGNNRTVAKVALVAMNAAEMGVLAPEDLHTFMDYLNVNCVPFYSVAPGTPIHTFPSDQLVYTPPIPANVQWGQFNEWCLLVNAWQRLYIALAAVGENALASQIRKVVVRHCQWIVDATGDDGSTPYFVSFPNGLPNFGEPPQSIAPYGFVRHFDVYSGEIAIFEYSYWAYHPLRIAQTFGIPRAQQCADAILARWKALPPDWSILNDGNQQWMVNASGQYEVHAP